VQCPHCEATTRVLESRGAEAGAAVRRRRECSSCGRRFTTYERHERLLFVRKRSGERQAFDGEKLRGALVRAAHKRPVSEGEIDEIVDRIEAHLEEAGGELAASSIGELCLDELRELDWGAYLQFAGTLPAEAPQLAGSGRAGSVRSEGDPA
jgi:transcriptional repressor NrdR